MALRWAKCKCRKCKKVHYDVVPSSILERDHNDEDNPVSSLCDWCFAQAAGNEAAKRYEKWLKENAPGPRPTR